MYDLREHACLSGLVDLVPQNCFVGQTEVIPGIDGDFYPTPRKFLGQPLS
jgi:hypothetical protein